MSYDQQKRLVERLLERSRSGDLDWQESAVPNAFQVSFSKYSVQIYHVDFGSGEFCRIEIKDSYGRTTESFSDSDLDAEGEHLSGSWYDVMREIFEIARRRSLKADEALESILAEMN